MTNRRYNEVDNYLSLKRVVMLSLAITIAYYFLFALSHYFGRTSFDNQDGPDANKVIIADTSNSVFGTLPARWPGLFKADRFQPGYRFRLPKFEYILLYNVPFTFLIIFAVFIYNRKIFGRKYMRRGDELLVNIIGTLLIAGVLSSVCTLIQLFIWPYRPGPIRSLMGYFSIGMLGDLSLVAIAFVFSYLRRSLYQERRIAVENEKLRAENMASRYETLKTQMDPHFLFNSLNTLKSLIDIDTEKAEDFAQQLSGVLRYTLKNEEVVTLAGELDCVRSYCKMMKMRYGDNLIFDHHINHEKYDHYYVLPLSIQGLIENAIKHNVISSKQPLMIRIMTDENNRLIISNEIHPKIGKEEGTGIGLANLAERYRIKWNENVEIFDDGKIFSVTLPLKQNE